MGILSAIQYGVTRNAAIDLAKGKGDEGQKATALAIVYLADVIKEGKK